MSDEVLRKETKWLDVLHSPMGQFFVLEELVITTWQKQDGSTYQTEEIIHHDFPGWDF